MRATILLLPLLLVACGQEPDESSQTPPQQPTEQPAEQAATPEQPGAQTDDAALLNAEPTDLGGIVVSAPAAWTSQPPDNPMRRAQFVVDGEAGEATCIVFFFAGMAGTIEANLDRWSAQFAQPDGSDSRERAVTEEVEINGRAVTTFSLTGRYIAETSPGSGQRLDNPDWAVRAAIVPVDNGAYYFKMTGPEATIAEAAGAFDAMIASIEG